MEQFYLGADVSKGYTDFVLIDQSKQPVENVSVCEHVSNDLFIFTAEIILLTQVKLFQNPYLQGNKIGSIFLN